MRDKEQRALWRNNIQKLPTFKEDMNIQIQESQEIPDRINLKIIKLLSRNFAIKSQWDNIFKILGNNFNKDYIHLNSFKNKREINIFPDKQKLSKFISIKPTL